MPRNTDPSPINCPARYFYLHKSINTWPDNPIFCKTLPETMQISDTVFIGYCPYQYHMTYHIHILYTYIMWMYQKNIKICILLHQSCMYMHLCKVPGQVPSTLMAEVSKVTNEICPFSFAKSLLLWETLQKVAMNMFFFLGSFKVLHWGNFLEVVPCLKYMITSHLASHVGH